MKEYLSLDEAVCEVFGNEISVDRTVPVSGGDINDSYACELSDGTKVFMKSNRRENLDFFRREVEGLQAIDSTGTIKTPEVLALGTDKNRSFLLLSHISAVRPSTRFNENFGKRLADLHSAPTESFVQGGRFGFIHDNYIGAGYQINTPCDKWIDFFRERRLKPQFDRASHYLDKEAVRKAEKLLDKLDCYLTEPERPSLLHGDLWSGNYMTGNDGEAWLIDPAAYVGHAEADIAMTELFGGFSRDFYRSYKEARPLDRGYEDRKELYNLYHLLNHLNLFGGSYLYSVIRVLDRYV